MLSDAHRVLLFISIARVCVCASDVCVEGLCACVSQLSRMKQHAR